MLPSADLEPGLISVLAAQLSDDLYRALLAAAASSSDLRIVGRAADPLNTLLMVAAQVDIVVLEGEQRPGLVGHLLGEYPDLKVVVFHADGGATIYWRGIAQRTLPPVALAQLYLPLRAAYAIEPTG